MSNEDVRRDDTVEALVSFASALEWDQLTLAAIHEAKRRVIDSFAIALAGYDEEPSIISRRMALENSAAPGATVLGTRHRSSPELAAFANGTMIHSQDFMDTYLSRESLHPSDTISAVLAAAESSGANGRRALLGVVLAYELMCQLADVANVRERGWDHVVFGAVSSALASAKVLGLCAEPMRQTLALAAVANTALRQTRVGEVPMWKAFAPANAARNGLFAARLAALGVTGPVQPFQGEKGFERQVSGSLALRPFGSKGSGYKINETYIKIWPVQYNTQAGIEAALQIRERAGDLRDIRRILIDIAETGRILSADTAAKWDPETRETADHSLPYIVVSALVDGAISRGTFDRDRFRDPAKLALVRKVEVRADPAFTARYPESLSVRVTVFPGEGEAIVAEVEWPKGHARRPLTDGEVEEKFTKFAQPRLGEDRTKVALEKMWAMDELEDVGELMNVFELTPGETGPMI